MITVEVNRNDLEYVQRRLGDLQGKAAQTLKNAVNKTARDARRRLAEEARGRYTPKNAAFFSRMEIKPKATNARPVAVISVKGRTLTLPRFHVTQPKRPGAKSEIVKGTGLKAITGPRKIKSFLGVLDGNQQVMQRRGSKRVPLRVMRGPSFPKMLEKVYGGGFGHFRLKQGLKKEIEEMYHQNVEAAIEKRLIKG